MIWARKDFLKELDFHGFSKDLLKIYNDFQGISLPL